MTVSVDFENECKAIAHVEDGAATICCWLPGDHGGLHWDKHDGIWWSTDAPELNDAHTDGAV